MAIKAICVDINEIPEKYRDLYEEKDGVFRLIRIEGLKSEADITRLSNALENERQEHARTKQRFDGVLGGKKVEEIQALLNRIPELEAAASGKIDDTKINEMVESRLRTKVSPIELERDTYRNQTTELQQQVAEYTAREKRRYVVDAVRQAAVKMKVLDTAMEDVFLLAERMFEVSDNGNVTVKDNVGATPGVSPEVWLAEFQNKRPHWWPASIGGGARGSGGVGGYAKNPWSEEYWSLTEQGKYFSQNGLEKATQMAAAVGVDFNNPRKPTKK
jgi:hypothetical protein